MAPKVKGLFKGFKYITQIFGNVVKEPVMEIGYPTDVRHVAHIGFDCDSAHAPSPDRLQAIEKMTVISSCTDSLCSEMAKTPKKKNKLIEVNVMSRSSSRTCFSTTFE
ncbi:hypothetical protein KSP40_PGU009317 [Platanthera guangdongensis]|uniref:CRIB domain-containing protein n=1 Tax=Platanthera guangdongensis TaxID=2320717 RepID=A0ABR2MVJ3_9ASPA